LEEVVEHSGEVFAAGIFYIHGRGDFGDGSDRAVVGIEDEFFDLIARRL
jgi:hypothetical protein